MPPRARDKQPPDLPAEPAVPSGSPSLGPVVGSASPEPTSPAPVYTPPAPAYSSPVVYSQYAVAPSRPYNPWAIVSICFAASTVIGTLCMGGLVAVITGHIARSQIKRSGEQGNSLALAGLIVGYVSIGLTLAFIAVYVLFFIFVIAFAASHSGPSPTPSPQTAAVQNPPEELPPPPPASPPLAVPHTRVVGQEAAPVTAVPTVPPGYVTPGTGPGHTNTAAIISLITAIFAPLGHCIAVGGFALIITSIATGHMALSQIKRTGEDGRGLAIAGLIISYVHLASAILTVIFFFGAIFAFFAALIGAGATSHQAIAQYTPPPSYPPQLPPAYGYYQPPTDGMAIASLVLGGLAFPGVCCYGVGAIALGVAGLVLGRMSLGRIRSSGGRLGGESAAQAGWIIGLIAAVIGLIVMAAWIAIIVFGFAISTLAPKTTP